MEKDKVKEFRIGNWIKSGHGFYRIVIITKEGIFAIEDKDDNLIEVNNTIINPTPITPKILLNNKFTFKEAGGYNGQTEVEYDLYRYNDFSLAYKDGKFYIWDDCEDGWYSDIRQEVESVHDLQNIYYYNHSKTEIEINL